MSQNNMEENRMNPDKLLQQVKASEEKEHYGHLKIFLGASAGVGKTYAMLKTAGVLLKEGEDIVIGYVETHERAETKAAIPENIEYIPLKLIEYKGIILKELDIDAVLARRPKIVIVDELAHTNAPGSRNNKRYQDVMEILNAGIDVFTSLNIQHIESLNDIVTQIVDTKINETVPDQLIDMADDVVLIDLPPEELIDRLNEGKIYPNTQIQASVNNFFRKGNLSALRELSLRKTAQKVDQQVLEYRQDQFIDDLWANDDKLLLVLEPGYSTEKIVRSSKNTFDKGFSKWFVGYIESTESESKSLRDKQNMQDLIELAKQLGATPIQLIGADPAVAITSCIEENNISTVVIAQYRLSLYYRLFGKSLAEELHELAPNVNIQLVSDEIISINETTATPKKVELNYPKLFKKSCIFFGVFVILGLIMHELREWINNENIILFYLLAIIVSNSSRGKISAIIASIIASASYYVFVAPSFSLMSNNWQYIITLLAMMALGITFSVITGNLRYQVKKLNKWRQYNEWLNKINEDFAAAMINDQILEVIPTCFNKIFHCHYMMLFPNHNEVLELKSGKTIAGFDPVIAEWVYTNNHRAGLNTDTFSLSSLMYIPVSKARPMCVIVLKPDVVEDFFMPDIQNVFDNFIKRLAISLERIHFTQVAIHTKVAIAKQQ